MAETQKPKRIVALDALRGLAILVMALDHTSLYITQTYPPAEAGSGVFPVFYDPLRFLTRFFGLPGRTAFFFLMGVGMTLFAHSRHKRGWSRGAILRHFAIRGLVLIAIELLIMNRGWELLPLIHGLRIHTAVLTALALTSILASLLVVAMQAGLKPVYGLVLAGVLFVGVEWTHALPGITVAAPSSQPWLRRIELGLSFLYTLFVYPGGNRRLGASFAVLPYLEVVILGNVFGRWLIDDPQRALRRARNVGIAFLLAGIALRLLDGFGNVRPRMGNSWIDYMTLVAKPPSMVHTLVTMGLNLLMIWFLTQACEQAPNVMQRVLWPLVMFGRAPLFFYVCHVFVYAALGYWLAPNGAATPWIYPFWLLGLLILFLPTWWYGRLKRRQPANSALRYL